MDGIPTYRTDQELPGIPLAWLQADQTTPVPLLGMGAVLKVQILLGDRVVTEQTTDLLADDVVPNWVMAKFSAATLDDVEDDLIASACRERIYDFVPMYRRLSDDADDVWDPDAPGFPIRFRLAPS